MQAVPSRNSPPAWRLASVYLGSLGAEPLEKDAPLIVGYSEDTTCYVSLEYFSETDPFADFVVHEAAHVFHNTKRRTLGFPETRTREWLLGIDFRKRETFAYACEDAADANDDGRLNLTDTARVAASLLDLSPRIGDHTRPGRETVTGPTRGHTA